MDKHKLATVSKFKLTTNFFDSELLGNKPCLMTLMNDRPSSSIRTARRSPRIVKEKQFSIIKVYNGDFTRVPAFAALLKIIISPLSVTAMYSISLVDTMFLIL